VSTIKVRDFLEILKKADPDWRVASWDREEGELWTVQVKFVVGKSPGCLSIFDPKENPIDPEHYAANPAPEETIVLLDWRVRDR
jgi:hypothetical protein